MQTVLDALPELAGTAAVVLVDADGRLIGNSSHSQLPSSELRILANRLFTLFRGMEQLGTPATEGIFTVGETGQLSVLIVEGHALVTLAVQPSEESLLRAYHQTARTLLRQAWNGEWTPPPTGNHP